MRCNGKQIRQHGFALPTVLLAAVIMMIILVTAAAASSSVRNGLNTQYYNKLAREAAESGSVYASKCLEDNSYEAVWVQAGRQLQPNRACDGTMLSDVSNYLIDTDTMRTTFTVDGVTSGAGVTRVRVTGRLELLRQSSGTVWKTYSESLVSRMGGQVAASRVILGYSSSAGVFYGVVGQDGVLYAAGANSYGQLGNGTTNTTVTPTIFGVPKSAYIVRAYANFLSVGMDMFAVAADGTAWAAGSNDHGETGTGIVSMTKATPAKVAMPAGVSVVSVAPAMDASFFLGSDNHVYAAGTCAGGLLGSGYTIAGCSDRSTPVRVALPTPDVSDPNTIPTTNIVSDRSNAYVRMAGGAVYGWGVGDRGQLGGNSFADSSTPVKIGSYGDAGKPKAKQIVFDGDTLYILDDQGRVSSLGSNNYGEMGTPTMALVQSKASGNCLANYGGDGVRIGLWPCNGRDDQKFQLKNNTVYNPSMDVCLDNKSGDGKTLQLSPCNGSATQKFVWQPSTGTLYNPRTDKCVSNSASDGKTVILWPCHGYTDQFFRGYSGELQPFDMSGISGTITKIWADQWALVCLTSKGQVWSAGVNTGGQFGDGTTGPYYPNPVRFNMPVSATDIYTTNVHAVSNYKHQNTYAIGSNGKVYGAGGNSFGQLGNGTVSDHVAIPVAMSVIDGSTVIAKQVQSGLGTTVIFTADGAVYTVGSNDKGQLGDGTTTNSSVPIRSKYINKLTTTVY